ncbi:hypothetical protein AALO_G00186580 [Alosa alosa]|uniref:Uncharacterized protein n=1 Tax=Alosa alosa TaxID=278164 RepID=A0AAV6G941_9TELE|nr:hypothetical protein AALO_G00186580 [Alosa alosa]
MCRPHTTTDAIFTGGDPTDRDQHNSYPVLTNAPPAFRLDAPDQPRTLSPARCSSACSYCLLPRLVFYVHWNTGWRVSPLGSIELFYPFILDNQPLELPFHT